jgi:membrane protease YdiL (CAAX protease family)
MKMLNNICVRAILGAVAGAVMFFGIGYGLKSVAGNLSVFAAHALLKGTLIVISLIAWALMRRPWSQMGWQPARPGGRKWLWYLIAAVAMGFATIVMILTENRHPIASQFSFVQVIVSVWLLSSISEEIFVRGLVQSWIAAPISPESATPKCVIIASACLFAGLHVPLIWKGGGALGGGVIVAATFFVGWAAAEIRARSGSLLHAIGVHIVGNIAALPFGVIGAIVYAVIHGHPPQMK